MANTHSSAAPITSSRSSANSKEKGSNSGYADLVLYPGDYFINTFSAISTGKLRVIQALPKTGQAVRLFIGKSFTIDNNYASVCDEGYAADFQIYLYPKATLTIRTESRSHIDGIIYAPSKETCGDRSCISIDGYNRIIGAILSNSTCRSAKETGSTTWPFYSIIVL